MSEEEKYMTDQEEVREETVQKTAKAKKGMTAAEFLGVDRASMTVPRLAGLGILTAITVVL